MSLLHILVDIDTIIDTRLGVLDEIDPAAAAKAFQSDDYYFRVEDDFTDICGIGREQFRAAYARRSEDTLKRSVISPSIMTLKDIIVNLETAAGNHPQASKPIVEVNTWPYTLTDETRRFLRAAIGNYAGMETAVLMVHHAPQDITVAKLKEKYGAYFVYDFAHWLRLRIPELEHQAMPRVQVFAPSLLEIPLPSPEDMEQLGLERSADPLRVAEASLAPSMAVDFMPTFMFCIFRPEKQALWMDQAYHRIQQHHETHPLEQANIKAQMDLAAHEAAKAADLARRKQ